MSQAVLHLSLPGTIAVWIYWEGDCGRLGHQLVQQLQSLRRHLGGEHAHAGGIAARPVKAGYESSLDRIRADDKKNPTTRAGALRNLSRGKAPCGCHQYHLSEDPFSYLV